MSKRLACCGVFAIMAALLAGCAATGMKATPFFTGEYEKAQGKPEDRVNLWPLAYYRKPALSILWPIGEVTDKHVAVRPLVAVRKLDKDRQEIRVLWPLCELDFDVDSYWVFPAIWGDLRTKKPYAVVFPLFWYKKAEHSALFPLWMHFRGQPWGSLHLLWPIVNVKNAGGEKGWRVWPLYGQYDEGASSRRYALWPLVMSLRSGDEHTRWALPFYAGSKTPEGRWDLVLPAFYRSRSPEQTRTALLPFYYLSRHQSGNWLWLSLPYMGSRKADSRWDLVPPFYYGSTGPEGKKRVLFPLYWDRLRDGERRTTLVPLFYRARSQKDDSLTWLSLPYMGSRKGDRRWDLVPPFYYGSTGPEGRRRVLFPLYWDKLRDGERRTTLLPLFYRARSEKDDSLTWLSLPYLSHREPDSSWHVVPPVFFRSSTPEKQFTTVLPAFWHSRAGDRLSTLLFPLFYRWTDGDDYVVLTPAGGASKAAEKKTFYAFPLLSAYSKSPESKRLWFLFPLTYWRWQEGLARSHILPLYYYDRDNGLFLSLPFSRQSKEGSGFVNSFGLLMHYAWTPDSWELNLLPAYVRRGKDLLEHGVFPLWLYERNADRAHLNIGLLLADYTSTATSKELWAPFFLGGYKVEDGSLQHHLFPLWLYERNADRAHLNIGLLLADYTSTATSKELWAPFFLGGYKVGEDSLRHHLFPLWYYKREGERRHLNIAGPLADYTSTPDWKRLWLPFPLGGYRVGEDSLRHHLFPLWYYKRQGERWHLNIAGPLADYTSSPSSKTLWAPFPLARLKLKKTGVSHHVFPLWYYGREGTFEGEQKAPAESEFNLLWFLYDHKEQVTESKEEPGTWQTYVRSRILWRVMHYERVDDYTTLDVLPGITYDNKPGEKKVFSFLWRVFRYEWDKEEGRKYHVLFIPF